MIFDLFRRFLGKVALIAPGGFSVRPWLHRLRGAKIGRGVWIAQLVYLDELHPDCISIGDNCTIGLRTSIFAHFYWGPKLADAMGKVIIEKNVFIGPHCVILPNITIGEGAVVKAGTVVSRNVPAHAFFGSAAAEMLGTATVPLTQHHSYEEFTQGVRLRPHRRPASEKRDSPIH